MRALTAVILLSLLMNSASAANARGKAAIFTTAVKVLGGVTAILTAAGAYSEADMMSEIHDKMDELKKQGFNTATDGIYSVVVDVDPKASDRWFFSPNLYLLVQIPGYGDYIPRSFIKSYKGGKWTFSFFAPAAKTGSIWVHAMDNKHEFFNTSLNSLLKTRIDISLSPEFSGSFGAITGTVRVQQLANLSLRLLDEDVTFSPPSVIASSEIRIPADETWTSTTQFYSKGKNAGTMYFSCLTTGSQLRAAARRRVVNIILIAGFAAIVLYVCFKYAARTGGKTKESGA